MSTAIVPSQPETYLGHVRRGVIVLDTPMPLVDGSPVRIQMLQPLQPPLTQTEKTEKFRSLMQKWNEEDAQVTDDEVRAFQKELEEERGRFRDDEDLESLLLDN